MASSEGNWIQTPIILTTMVYADLKPIRTGLAETPETSDFTSIQARIREWATEQETSTESQEQAEGPTLLPFQGATGDDQDIPFTFHDYLELLDWTGRAVRPDKRGAISSQQPPILVRLGIDARLFIRHMKPRPTIGFHRVIGKLNQIRYAAERFGMQSSKVRPTLPDYLV